MLTDTIFNNCAMDLQRAAQWYYLNPQGQTYQIFLRHARKILAKKNNRLAIKTVSEIGKIEKEIAKPKKARIYLADKILTLGCLLRK